MLEIDRQRLHQTAQRVTGFGDEPKAHAVSKFKDDLAFVFETLKARRGTILKAVGLSILAAVGYIWITPPLYTATAELMIDPRKRDIVKQEIVPSGLGSSSLGADTFLLDSQIEVLQSQNVLRTVIDDLDLTADQELAGTQSTGIVRWIKDGAKFALRGPQADKVTQMSPVDRVLLKLGKRLDVRRKGNTYVVQVSMTTEDAEKSALIANALTDTYIASNIDTARSRVRQAEGLLTSRLQELKDAALATREKVEVYRAANGLVGADKVPLAEQQLRELNQQLTIASAAATRARARWDEVAKLKDLPLDAALAAGSLQSNLLAALQDRYAQLASQEAALGTSLMPRHPNLVSAREAKRAVEREIRTEIARLVSRTKADFEVAAANEASLKKRVATARAQTADSNKAGVTLAALENEAQAANTIYEEFLARSKDAREQVTLPTDSVRIVSPAYVPTKPSWPVEPLILAAAAFAGLVIGIGLALLLQLTRGAPVPRPRPEADYLPSWIPR